MPNAKCIKKCKCQMPNASVKMEDGLTSVEVSSLGRPAETGCTTTPNTTPTTTLTTPTNTPTTTSNTTTSTTTPTTTHTTAASTAH